MNYRREAKRISKLPLDRDALAGVIEHALRNAHDNGSRERTPALCAETGKTGKERPWPPRAGDRARWQDGGIFTFTGERNASGGYQVNGQDGKPAGGLGDHVPRSPDWTLIGPIAAERARRGPQKCGRCGGTGKQIEIGKWRNCRGCNGTGRAASGTPGDAK